MNMKNNKLFKNSLFYSLGTILTKAIGFFMLPLYTHFLSDSSYGIATTITTFSATCSIILMLSLRAALIRFYNNYETDERKKFIGSIVLFVILNSLLCVALMIILKDCFISFIFPDINFFPTILLGFAALCFESIYLIYQSFLQAKQDGKTYSINSFLFFIFHTILNILFVTVVKLDYVGMVLSLAISEFVFAVFGIVKLIIKKELLNAFLLLLVRVRINPFSLYN